MENQLFIPTKIKVGFQKREDTYTKKLAYVIYFDNKGVLRKETSWESWRDKKIDAQEFDNVPTEGFVLNKKAGGYSSGWNHRQTYCRVFDPRGFEFEITVPNLLFILQENSSVKGKGLDGEFVYSWDGKDLVLLPAHCEEYKNSQKYTLLQSGKIGAKDLVEGCSYKTKKQEDLIYLGKLNWFAMDYIDSSSSEFRKTVKDTKYYVFVREGKIEYGDKYVVLAGLTSLASKNSDICVSNYAELIDEYSKSKFGTKPVGLEAKPKVLKFKNRYGSEDVDGAVYLNNGDDTYDTLYFREETEYDNKTNQRITKGFSFEKTEKILFKDGKLLTKYHNRSYNYNDKRKVYTKEELANMDFQELYVKLESGSKIKFDKYN